MGGSPEVTALVSLHRHIFSSPRRRGLVLSPNRLASNMKWPIKLQSGIHWKMWKQEQVLQSSCSKWYYEIPYPTVCNIPQAQRFRLVALHPFLIKGLSLGTRLVWGVLCTDEWIEYFSVVMFESSNLNYSSLYTCVRLPCNTVLIKVWSTWSLWSETDGITCPKKIHCVQIQVMI